ncbi:MAG: hypothetical protein ACREQF_13760, partial [Candidatus Binataceae bacterium]
VPTRSPANAPLAACSGCATIGQAFTCKINATMGTNQRVRIVGFSVTGTPNGITGSDEVTLSGFSGTAPNLRYRFNLSGQVAAAAATDNELTVIFPVPLQSALGGSITLFVPNFGPSGTSPAVMCGSAWGVSFVD